MAKKKNNNLTTVGAYKQSQGTITTVGDWKAGAAEREAQKKERIRQAELDRSRKWTNFWQETAAHEQSMRGDGSAPSTYIAKLMSDSHSSVEEENARRERVASYLNDLRNKRQEKESHSTFGNWKASQNTPGSNSTQKNQIGKKTTELEDMLLQKGIKPKGYTGKETTPDLGNKERPVTVGDYNQYLSEKFKLRDEGRFDSDKIPVWMSDKGLETNKRNTQTRIDEIDEQIQELKERKWERENWRPETAMQDWEDMYGSMRDGTYSQGENLLAYLEDDKNILKRAEEYSDRFRQGGQIGEDDLSRQRARERAFNYVFGQSDENSGMYDIFTEGMSAEEKARLDDKLDGIIEGMVNPYEDFDYDQESYNLEEQRKKLEKELGQWNRELENRDTLSVMMANAPDPEEYADPVRRQLTPGNNVMQYIVNAAAGPQGDDMDRAYWEIIDQQSKWNNMTTEEKLDMVSKLTGNKSHNGLAESLQDTTEAFGQYYAFMTPEEVTAFQGYYEADDKEGARAFLEALKPYLSAYANEYSKYAAQQASKGKYGGVYGAMTIAAAPLTAMVGVAGTGAALLGDEEAGDVNSVWYRGQNILNTIRQGRKQAWGDAASKVAPWLKAPAEFLNGVFYSMADMAMATGIGGVLSPTSEISVPLVQFVMSSEAASNTMTEQLERGLDPTEAALRAIGSGVIEAVTEKYSLEQLLKPDVMEMLGDKKQIAKFIAKNFAAEASEEGASSILETGLDALLSAVNGHENEIQARYNELKSQYGPKKASQIVLAEQLSQTGMEMLAGGVSGLLMSSARVGMNSINQVATGKQIRNNNTSGMSGTDAIIDAALELSEETQSRKLAEELAAKREAEEEISDTELGRLAQNIQMETNETIARTAGDVIEDRAFDKLEDSGKNDGWRRTIAKIISKAVTNGGVDTLSKEEKDMLINSGAAFDVYKDFIMFSDPSKRSNTARETIDEINEKTREAVKARDSVSELVGQKKRAEIDTTSAGDQLASDEEKEEALKAAGRTADSIKDGEIIVNGKIGSISGLKIATVEDEDGNKQTATKFTVNLNGEETEVTAGDIKAMDFETAAVVNTAARMPGIFSKNYIDTVLKAKQGGHIKNIGTFLADGLKLRMAGYTGQMMPVTGIDRTTAIEIYNGAMQEHAENRKAQVTGKESAAGPIMIDGAVYGTKAWNEKLKNIKDPNARAQIDTIAGLFAPQGIAVTFKTAAQMAEDYERLTGEKEDGAKIYGDESASGISINVEGLDFMLGEGGKATVKGAHNMVVTFGHEMTHYLQRHSMAGYNSLESYVFGQLQKNGMDVSRRVMQVMESQGLSIEDAMSEIVAESCDQILASAEVRNHIEQTNKTLFGEIKSFVSNLIERVKTAISGMKESQSYDSRVMMRSANELAKIWLGAYDEAISGAIRYAEGEKTGAPAAEDDTTRMSREQLGSGFRYSRLGTDPETGRSVYISNFAPNTENNVKRTALISLIQNVWSKKPIPLTISENGKNRTIQAYFNPDFDPSGARKTDIGKMAYPEFGPASRRRVMLNLVNDYKEILEESNYIEPDDDKKGRKEIKQWHYFVDEIYYVEQGLDEAEPYRIDIDIKETDDGTFVYQYKPTALENEQKKKLSVMGLHPVNTGVMSDESAPASEKTIPQNGQDGNTRFSMAQPIEETRDLIAAHNLTEEQFMKVLQLGGFAMPSIAIFRKNYAHNRYGDISVLFRKNTIDPKASRANKVYGGDAWTPTYPSVEYKLNEKKINQVLKKIKSLIPQDFRGGYTDLYVDNLQKSVNSSRGDIVNAVKDNMNLMAAYLSDQGKEIQYPTREKRLDGFGNLSNEQIKAVAEALGEETVRHAYEVGATDFSDNPELIERIRGILNETWREKHKEIKLKLLDKELYTKDNFGWPKAHSTLEAAYKYFNTGIEREIDEYALKDALEEQIDDEAYEEWLRDLFDGAIEKSGIRNNKDYYTNNGNPRSWEALHDEETLENVVKVMKQATEKGDAAFFGQSEMLALGTRDFKSVDEIRKHKDQLKHISDEELSAAKTSIVDRVSKLMDELRNEKEPNFFIARDRVLQAMVDAVRSSKSVAGITKIMNEWGYKVGTEVGQEIVDIMSEIANLPTEYFEAKPRRAVGTDEIAMVVLPETVSQELINALDERGIPYTTYDGTDEDRLEKMNSDESIRFSRATSESMDVAEWMANTKAWNLQTEDERMLLDKYKGLRTRRGLLTKTVVDLTADIKRKEGIIEKLTPAELQDLEKAREKLAEKQQQLTDTEYELFRVTSSDGYAGMMYRNNLVLNDFILGKTQDDVRESVEQMVDQVKNMDKLIEQQVKALRKLADSQAVKAVSSMIEKKSLNYAVNSLKSETNTAMGKKELESRLIEMALRKADGEDITGDARALALDMTNKMRGYQMDVLERMRGVMITIGPDERAEMKGNGLTLASVREALKGTGVRVQYGDFSSLDTDTQEGGDLRTLLPELPPDIGENSADALNKFITWAQSMRDADTAAKQSMVDLDDTTATVMALTSTIKIHESSEYKKQNQLAAQTNQMADELEQTRKTMNDSTELAGKRAVGMASILQRDVHEAIKYYNTIARVAAQEEKQKVRKNIIDELKSENTRKLVQQQMKYEEMMKNDRKARGLAEDNLQIRNRISTVASRVRKRMMEETDLKNIPEEAKPLARLMLKMLVQHDYIGYRHVLNANKKIREQTMKALDAWDKRDGEFKDEDLDWLIVGSGDTADWELHDRVVLDLMNIEQGLVEYRNAEGQKVISLMDRKAALQKIESAVMEIWGVIAAREEANLNGQRMLISELALQARDDMAGSRFKGEWTGKIGHGIGAVKSGVVYGNMTPEYFFKNLRNGTISRLYDEYHRAENRNGLEEGRAKNALAKIAEDTGYSTWDQEKRYTFQLEKGGTVNLTLGEMMSLYATWQREAMNQLEQNGPEKSFHLTVGGFYTAQEEKHKIVGREKFNQKAHRLTEGDMAEITNAMTPEQLEYVNRVVEYITKNIGALGNEASMRMYGIKKYNEKWYFPFEIWSGVKSQKSDQGAAGNDENRAAHASFTKRRKSNASNALVIRDFTQTAAKHIVQMINYNTFAPAIEFMNRVMNYQMTEEGEGEDSSTRRNLRTIFGEIYGKDAVSYLDDFNKDVNGGVVRAERTMYDKLLSTFKKGAVAGSLSVALQQPLSYIRASMMISPKYLAAALNPETYKGSREEMEKYSGVAVIKRMGKFDMNFGQSAQDYIMPEKKTGKGQKVYSKISDATTALPGAMDTMTWTRMWTACKLEQQAQNPGMDHNSAEFMEKVAERFNDVMRKTQVYDSMLVKSKNMRSQNVWMKSLTSFMAEPTLTANVLADAVVEAIAGDKGGKAKLAKAGATFLLSAIAQALVKGIISAGRSPDDKKTWNENVAYRFTYNFMNEVNPMSLIPGYSDLIEVLKKGELQDDAMSIVGKIMSSVQTTIKIASGQSTNAYRDVEDSVGQLAQLFTNIPAKNLMRDARAMWNFFTSPYANRKTSGAVLKYQFSDQFMSADNMLGVINTWLGEKGYKATNDAYFKRIYEADKAGKSQAVADMIEYLKMARNTKETKINSALKDMTKKDDKMTEEQKIAKLREQGMKDSNIAAWITEQYNKGEISKEDAKKYYQMANPEKDENDTYFQFERMDMQNNGVELESGGDYFRLDAAIESGNQTEINTAVKELKDHGYDESTISNHVKSRITNKYKAGEITKSQAESMLKKHRKDMTEDDIFWTLDRIDYTKQTGSKLSGTDKSYRLDEAIEKNSAESIMQAATLMKSHGVTEESISIHISQEWKPKYLAATGQEKIRLKDAITKALKAAGLTEEKAINRINGWEEKSKKK